MSIKSVVDTKVGEQVLRQILVPRDTPISAYTMSCPVPRGGRRIKLSIDSSKLIQPHSASPPSPESDDDEEAGY